MEDEEVIAGRDDFDGPYDRKPDEDVEDEEVAEARRRRRIWRDEHPWNQHDFL